MNLPYEKAQEDHWQPFLILIEKITKLTRTFLLWHGNSAKVQEMLLLWKLLFQTLQRGRQEYTSFERSLSLCSYASGVKSELSVWELFVNSFIQLLDDEITWMILQLKHLVSDADYLLRVLSLTVHSTVFCTVTQFSTNCRQELLRWLLLHKTEESPKH